MKTETTYFMVTETFSTSFTESFSELIKLYNAIKDTYNSIVIYEIENNMIKRKTVLKDDKRMI